MAYAPHFAKASRKYRPAHIRFLYIAEAPPAYASGRFFYFTSLTNGDTLFLEMMKVLYPFRTGFTEQSSDSQPVFDAKRIRQHKEELLTRFMHDGFYLIGALEQPMPEQADTTTKTRLVRNALPLLQKKVRRLCADKDIPIIFIGAIAYSVCADTLRKDGFRILNDAIIDHPARGGQKRFRRKLSDLLRSYQIKTSDSVHP